MQGGGIISIAVSLSGIKRRDISERKGFHDEITV
jgi:hypothetical protein